MLFNVTHVHGDYDRFEKRFPASAFDPEGQPYRVVEPVDLAFDITKDDRRFHLVGTVKGTLELACGRCLEPFRLPIDAAFDLRYLPRTENVGEGEQEIEEDDLTTAFYVDDCIDLAQLMGEQFHLALPMKPLCGTECRGLCSQCGMNLNTGSCSCRTEWEDPRMAPLKALLEPASLVPDKTRE
jgi:uncharacterized protein